MVQIRIYFVYEILLLAEAIEESKITFCENSDQKYQILTCPENNTMSLKSIIYGDPPCQNANNNRICHSIIDNYFNDHCLGQNNCTLPVQILSNNSCQPPPRRLKVKFKCDIMWWPDKHFGYVDTCANSLLKVSCSNGSIRIKNVTSYSDTGGCNEMKNGCVKDRLEDLCDVKTLCSKDTNTDSCLFHKRFAIIDYVCKSPSDPEATESILGTSTDNALDMTTSSTSNTVKEGTSIPEECVLNPSSKKLTSVKSGFPTLGVAVGVPMGITGMICIIFAVVFIRRRSVHRNLVIENAEDRTITGATSRIQETGLYECTNVTDRSSDHTYDPLNLKN
ncbi:uncharacterized protein LOC143045001 [Mytilus galloprovincialis]|uniref:uncharacterized protein LOC143045001 n=1 Tax=Mytilus galloprovincialis TaxID=29158 RepID=UPI003F7B6307